MHLLSYVNVAGLVELKKSSRISQKTSIQVLKK